MPSVSSLDEAAEALAAANGEDRRLRIGVDLTTDGLSRILEHETGDLTCTVEAGVRLSELNAELGARGQRLSLDPPGNPTIGAVIAGNLSGPLRHRFGAPRDLLLGVTIVLADGTVANAGGKVVKNVAGYDLARLVCGSQGRLALVARASFRLHPLPTASATLVAEPDDVPDVVGALRRSQLQASALDVLHPGPVAVLFEGSPGAVDAQLAAARAIAGEGMEDPSVWEESRRRQGAARGIVRFDPGGLSELLAQEPEAVVRPSAGVAYTGEKRVSGSEPQSPERAALERLHERIRLALDPHGVLSA